MTRIIRFVTVETVVRSIVAISTFMLGWIFLHKSLSSGVK